MAGQAARNASTWSSPRISGGGPPDRVRLDSVPASQAAASAWAAAKPHPAAAQRLQRVAHRGPGRPRTPAAHRDRMCWPPRGTDRVQHGQGHGARHRVAAERAAVVALASRSARVAQPDAGPPAAQALGQRDFSAAPCSCGAGAAICRSGSIHNQQRAGGVAGVPGRLQVAGRATLAQGRLRNTAAVSPVTAARSAAASPCRCRMRTVRPNGANGSRIELLVSASAPMGSPVEPVLGGHEHMSPAPVAAEPRRPRWPRCRNWRRTPGRGGPGRPRRGAASSTGRAAAPRARPPPRG